MKRVVAALIVSIVTTGVQAADVTVLSAGAVEPGLHNFAAVVKRELGHELKIQFNTAPQIAKRLAANETYDVLISPPPAINGAVQEGKVLADTRTPVGRVGAGMVVRKGATPPRIATVDALKQAVTQAESIVYNTASTGLYLDKLFAQLGVLDTIKPRTTRYPDGASVLEHVIKGKGNEIGFGAITEIRLYEPKGLQYVGPLPPEVQNYTSYEAVVMTGSTRQDAARAVLKLLATPAGKSAFVSGGVE